MKLMDGAFLLREVSNGMVHPVPPGRTVAGRSEEAGIQFDDESISRNHAALLQEQNALWVEDLGSSNGTFVQGLQVHGLLRVHPGDVLVLGRLQLKIELEEGVVPVPAPPPRGGGGSSGGARLTQKLGPFKPLRAPEVARSGMSAGAAGDKAKGRKLGWWVIGLLVLALGALAWVVLGR